LFIGIGFFIISFIFFLGWILPFFNKNSLINESNISNQNNNIVSLGDEEPEPYIYRYASQNSFGIINYKEVNWSYFKSLFNAHTSWILEYKRYSYSDWTNGNQYLSINKTWNENGFWKIGLTLNVPVPVYSARFTFGCDLVVLDYVERSGYEVWLNYTVPGTTEVYSVFFNWSDMASIPNVVFTHGKTNDMFWFRFSRDNIPAGTYYFDPLFGVIADVVVDSYEYDTDEGRIDNPNSAVRMGTSTYYLTCAAGDTGTDNDGFLRTINISDSGVITKSVVDSWEYDITNGFNSCVLNVSGDIYVVAYRDTSVCTVFTTTAYSSNGTLKKNVIDTFSTTVPVTYCYLYHFTNNIYILTYQNGSGDYDVYYETIEIGADGSISDHFIDIQDVYTGYTDTNYGGHNYIERVDDNTVVTWVENAASSRIITYNVSSSGVIDDTQADYWTTGYFGGSIIKVSNNIYAFARSDSTNDGFVSTFNISNTGMITKSYIDTLEYLNADCNFYNIINIASADTYENGTFAILYVSAANAGVICTFDINKTGTVSDAITDSLSFVAGTFYVNTIVHIKNNFYACFYMAYTSYDGWVATFNISSPEEAAPPVNNAPTISCQNPSNASTNIALTPTVSVCANDTDGNTLTVNWYENSTGTWTLRQTNNSVTANTSVYWVDTLAVTGNTMYWWNVTVYDGTVNVSSWNSFTTITNRSGTQVFDNYFVCNNITTRTGTQIFDKWFQCNNVSTNNCPFISDTLPENNSVDVDVDTDIWVCVVWDDDGDHTWGNMTCSNGDSHEWINKANGSSDKGITFTGLDYDTVYTVWVNYSDSHGCSVFEWFVFTTEEGEPVRTTFNVFDYWFFCGNTSSRVDTQVFDYWFLCGNATNRIGTMVFDNWFQCGNITTRTDTNVFNYWFLCGNTTTRIGAQVFDYYFQCSNTSSRTSTMVFGYWFSCGNITTRIGTQVFDFWFYCGNNANRIDTQIFDYYFLCSNGTRTVYQILDNWFYCGNGTRTSYQDFNYFFVCGNGTSRPGTQSNGTFNVLDYNASGRFTNYFWRIMVDDGSSWVNGSYSFRTEGYANVALPVSNVGILGLIGFFGVISFVFIFRWLRRKND
jgi:hypothetical protein